MLIPTKVNAFYCLIFVRKEFFGCGVSWARREDRSSFKFILHNCEISIGSGEDEFGSEFFGFHFKLAFILGLPFPIEVAAR